MKKEEFRQIFDDTMNDLPEDLLLENIMKTAAETAVETAIETAAETAIETAAETAAKKDTKRHFGILIAAGLAALLLLGAGILLYLKVIQKNNAAHPTEIIYSSEMTEGTQNHAQPVYAEPAALVTPVYPERAQKDTADPKYWDALRAERQIQREAWDVYRGKLTDYYKKSLQVMIAENPNENALCSPANVYLALATLAECADGDTRQEILDTLGVADIEEMRQISYAFFTANYQDDGNLMQRFANSVWLNAGSDFSEAVLETLRDQYFASAFQGTMGDPAYDRALQDWLNEQTGGILREITSDVKLPAPEDGLGVMSLVSTIYFRASWSDEFDESLNTEDLFHGSVSNETLTYMHSDKDMDYYEGEHFGAVFLNLGDSAAMWLILPNEGTEVRALASDEAVLKLIAKDHPGGQKRFTMVHLALPKFDVSTDRDLKDDLREMGIEEAFSAQNADFSALISSGDSVCINKVQNGLRVAVDEEGVTAASFVQITMDRGDGPDGEVDFTLNRPFLYAITSNTGALLFAGIVEQF